MTDLRKLIEVVEGGNLDSVNRVLGALFAADHSLPWIMISNVNSAFRGSLDAAKALHEALISSCQANIELSGEVWVLGDETAWNYVEAKVYANPARAWLLAILKAYEAQQ